jgi:pimeloyl-ACP methyl ester carboxylesterase
MTTPGSVFSRDGTAIGHRESGSGPGVVLVHGAMQSARSFTQLAHELSTSFHVYVPDRRGRGDSGPFGGEYGLAREIEDLDALLRKTGARFVFGLSSGALIAMAAARALGTIERLAVYEPPLTVNGADPAAWAPRFLRQLDRGRLASAMVTVIQGTGDVEPITYVPRILLTPLLWLGMRADAARRDTEHVAIRDLVATVRYDVQIQREVTSLLDSFAGLRCETLLLGGTRSHPTLRSSLDALSERLPRAKRVRLPRSGHLAADDVGRPKEVAEVLRAFFSPGLATYAHATIQTGANDRRG